MWTPERLERSNPSTWSDDYAVRLGVREIWGGQQPVELSRADRRRHVYVLGQTGTGKSTLLRNMILQDIAAGEGVGLIDPHGDLAGEVLDRIPSWRSDDVIHFDPADQDWPIALNWLLLHGGRSTALQRNLIAAGLVSAMKGVWRESWGPRMEYLLTAGVLALLECENVSLLGLPRLLVDVRYREWVMNQVTDPFVRHVWLDEFGALDRRTAAEWIAPIQNKIGQLFVAAPIRNVLGQVRNRIDFRFVMDRKRILIANLAKGRLGEEGTRLLGSMLVAGFEQAALSRVELPPEQRQDFHLYVDEVHNFTSDRFAGVLSESRKYGLTLTAANQYLDQLMPAIRDAIFGNVGTVVALRCGERDAATMARQFGGGVTAEQFSDLRNFQALVRRMASGDQSEPVTVQMEPPIDVPRGRGEALIRQSRMRFGSRRDEVESRIERWLSGS